MIDTISLYKSLRDGQHSIRIGLYKEEGYYRRSESWGRDVVSSVEYAVNIN